MNKAGSLHMATFVLRKWFVVGIVSFVILVLVLFGVNLGDKQNNIEFKRLAWCYHGNKDCVQPTKEEFRVNNSQSNAETSETIQLTFSQPFNTTTLNGWALPISTDNPLLVLPEDMNIEAKRKFRWTLGQNARRFNPTCRPDLVTEFLDLFYEELGINGMIELTLLDKRHSLSFSHFIGEYAATKTSNMQHLLEITATTSDVLGSALHGAIWRIISHLPRSEYSAHEFYAYLHPICDLFVDDSSIQDNCKVSQRYGSFVNFLQVFMALAMDYRCTIITYTQLSKFASNTNKKDRFTHICVHPAFLWITGLVCLQLRPKCFHVMKLYTLELVSNTRPFQVNNAQN